MCILGLSDLCLGVEKIFKEIYQYYTFTPKLLALGVGVMKITIFLVSLPFTCYIPNLAKIGSVVLEKRMLTNDAQ